MPPLRFLPLAALLVAVPVPGSAQAADTAIAEARAAVGQGNPWRATRLLQPVLADPAHRDAQVVLLAARAAAGWGGWAEVRSILGRGDWPDSLEDGEGHELLTRAALALADDSIAVVEARKGLALAVTPVQRGIRRVLLARALDRTGQLNEAGAAYASAVTELPDIGDWLRLRAVTSLATGPGAVTLGPDLTDSLVRAHAGVAVAAALARRKLYAAARDAYLAVGDTFSSVQAAVSLKADSAARAAAFALLAKPLPLAQTGQLIPIIDNAFTTLTPAEQLAIAHAAMRALQSARAVTGFEAAFAAGLGDIQDRLQYGQALVRSGKTKAGIAALARLVRDPDVGVQALYEEGRAWRKVPNEAKATRALRQVAERHPRDTTEAAGALFLLADQAVDFGKDDAALGYWRTLARRYPGHRLAVAGRFQAGIVLYARRQYRRAALLFDSLRTPDQGGAEANASGYWAGASWAAAHDSAAAADRWRELLARSPDSYYALGAARRLGVMPAPIPAAHTALRPDWVAAAEARLARLHDVGFDQEAQWEVERLTAFGGATDTLVAVGEALWRAGAVAAAARDGRLALTRPDVDSARALLLLYPLDAGEVLEHEARRRNVDPAFAAALIRQESGFDPEAVSAAGARGMMQVMPSVGATLARRLHFPVWDPVLLFQPDVNIELGMTELRRLLDRFGDPVRVLVAYNAGGTKPDVWARRHGAASDPDVFIERIPFAETRDYVRTVLRNQEMYRRLYGW